ncbi:50S ribosomal protein L10 [bacterium]|nr:50S ribosomal protein L10 [bacterium]
MATAKKIEIVNEYTEKFKSANAVYLADFKGIDVETDTLLRKKFRESNIEYKVLKNRLAKRALDNAGITGLDSYLKGVTAFAFGNDDPVVPAKIIKEFNNPKERLGLKVVYFEGKIFESESAAALAELPTRDVLISQFASVIQAPMVKLAGTLQATMQKMVGVLNSLKDNKTA